MTIISLLTAIIAFCAVFTALGLLFRILLGPVYNELASLKADIKELKNILIQSREK